MQLGEEVATGLEPLVRAAGLELYDVEVLRGLVRVFVTKPGGVDLDALAALNGVLSRHFDEHDPMPGRYTLEVSSPGLERPLRTPAHFRAAVGEQVTLRALRDGEPAMRLTGTLERADDAGIVVRTPDGEVAVRLDEVDRARTVFDWGAPPKGTQAKGTRAKDTRTKEAKATPASKRAGGGAAPARAATAATKVASSGRA